MRRRCPSLAFLLLLGLLSTARADVIRCTDAAGKVSYTDGACPPGARQTGSVAVPEAVGPDDRPNERAAQEQLDSVNRARELQRETVDAAVRQSQQPPAGATVIDGRGGANAPASASGDSGIVADTWYPDGAVVGGARPPRDMRPRLHGCDANGCNDRLGNHYNRQGQIDRYQNGSGKTCRQVNSTQVCR